MPDSAADLLDAANRAVDSQGNIDGHFLGRNHFDPVGVVPVLEHNAVRFEAAHGLVDELQCALRDFCSSQGGDQTGGPEAVLPLPFQVQLDASTAEGTSPQPAVTVRFAVVEGDAKVNGVQVAYVMTGDDGRAGVQVRNGTVDSLIAATVVPWPLPVAGCDPALPDRVEAVARVSR